MRDDGCFFSAAEGSKSGFSAGKEESFFHVLLTLGCLWHGDPLLSSNRGLSSCEKDITLTGLFLF
jgi:hypothetical protein